MSDFTTKKKLSASTIVGNIKAMVNKGELKGGEVLYRAIGIADGVREGTSTYGDWAGFTGDFEVTNCLTGEVFRGAQFFPDRSFTDVLRRKLDGNMGESVEFALECAIDVADHYPTGYSYVVRPIMENSVNRLEGLRQRLAALPAPDAGAGKSKARK